MHISAIFLILIIINAKLGIEKCGYKPSWTVLKMMFRWTKNFEAGKDSARERLSPYSEKLVVLQTQRDIARFLVARMNG